MKKSLWKVILLSILAYSDAKFEAYADHGGTIVAIAGRDYCVIASDSRLSESYMIRSREMTRLFQIEDDMVFAGSGCWSDIVALNAVLAREASIYKWDNRRRINIDALAFLLSHTLYMRRFMPYYSFSVLASFAHDGTGKLYRYDCVGSFESVGCLCVGRGEHLLQPIFDSLPLTNGQSDLWVSRSSDVFEDKEALCVEKPLEGAVELIVDAFRAAAEREISIGDGLNLWILRKGHVIEKRYYALPKS